MRIQPAKDFGTRECPSCATQVAANHNRCPICGYEFPAHPAGRQTAVWVTALILLIILIGSWVLGIW